MKVYFISGLGADKRAFSFLDLSFCEPVFIQWQTPAKEDELETYAAKLFNTINDEFATIVGLSLGGMLAVEIAKKHPHINVIIISSSKTYREVPAYLRMWRRLPVYKYLKQGTMRWSGKLILNILGAKGKEQRALQRQIIASSDPVFTRWAMGAVVNWRNTIIPKNIVHIHGSADKLLPVRYVKADHVIAGGGHVMIMDKAAEISAFLKKLIVQNAATVSTLLLPPVCCLLHSGVHHLW